MRQIYLDFNSVSLQAERLEKSNAELECLAINGTDEHTRYAVFAKGKDGYELKNVFANAVPVRQTSPLVDTMQPISQSIRQRVQMTIPTTATVSDFRQAVTTGNETKATLLYENNELEWFVQRGISQDPSGRIFDDASGFECSLWVLDEFMWERLLDVSRSKMQKVDPQRAHDFTKKLLAQYYFVKQTGLSYTVPSKIPFAHLFGWCRERKVENHFNYKEYTGELYNFVQSWPHSYREDLWSYGICNAQWWLPAHVTQEYLRSDIAFDPCPTFRTRFIYNGVDHRVSKCQWTEKDWYLSVYDKKNGFIKSRNLLCRRLDGVDRGPEGIVILGKGPTLPEALGDLVAMENLFRVRLAAFESLEQELLDLQSEYLPDQRARVLNR